MTQIQLGNIVVDVVKKDIKNIHLSVYPPKGRVRISAPQRMNTETIRIFAISKISWIKQQQKKLLAQARETPRDYVDRESHYYKNKRYLLKVIEVDSEPRVELRHSELRLYVKPGANKRDRAVLLDDWYRQQTKSAAETLIEKWEKVIGVELNGFVVRKMKTKWGSCTHRLKTIRLNSELIKKPADCLEYIVVHELLHLVEPTHNARFIKLMNRYMPQWQQRREMLNSLPVRHDDWGY